MAGKFNLASLDVEFRSADISAAGVSNEAAAKMPVDFAPELEEVPASFTRLG